MKIMKLPGFEPRSHFFQYVTPILKGWMGRNGRFQEQGCYSGLRLFQYECLGRCYCGHF